MLKHSKLNAPCGNREVVAVQSGASDTNPVIVELLQWSTEQSEPQELELLVYPLFKAAELNAALNSLPTFYSVRTEISWSHGAGSLGNSQRHSTRQKNPPGDYTLNPTYPDRELVLLGLPDHGLRFRLAARDVRVNLLVISNPMNFVAVGSIAPCTGGGGSDVIPPVATLYLMPQIIPFGAREFRVAAYPRSTATALVPDPTCLIQFNMCRYPNPLGAGGEYVYAASDCLDWRTIPGEAHSFQTIAEAYGTIEFR